MPRFTEHRLLPYTPEQLYHLVADVENYPAFLPWCLSVRITDSSDDELRAEMVVGFKLLRERFTSRVQFTPGRQIDVEYVDGPFRYLRNRWQFGPAPNGCKLDFDIDFEFRSRLLRKVMGPLFDEAVRRMIGAFEARARNCYGGRASGHHGFRGVNQPQK